MSERRGTKALETWCRRLTEGYPGVKIENMTTSWRDGLAFCAIIHHFRPDLIEFSTLTPDNIYYNNSLAFSIAERQLGIPALLDAEDMVLYEIPDRLSILTYLSQFYQVFGNQSPVATGTKQGPSQRIVPKRPALSADRAMIGPSSTSPPTKVLKSSSGSTSRREPCARCLLPVFLAERLNVGSKLFHRTCFRCARCNHQLSLANYYETEAEEFCCETCPDEEDCPKPKLLKFNSGDQINSGKMDSLSSSIDNISPLDNLTETDSGKFNLKQEEMKANTEESSTEEPLKRKNISPLDNLTETDSGKINLKQEEMKANTEESLTEEPIFDSLKRNNRSPLDNLTDTDSGKINLKQEEMKVNTEESLTEEPIFDSLKRNKISPLDNLTETDSGKINLKQEEILKTNIEESITEEPIFDSLKRNKLELVRNRSLSDEEKSKGLQKFEDEDDYSTNFEQNLEKSIEEDPLSKARINFLSTNMLNEDLPPPLPESKPPDLVEAYNEPLVNSVNIDNQPCTANLEDTKETKETNRSSLVKTRLLLFDTVPLKNNSSENISTELSDNLTIDSTSEPDSSSKNNILSRSIIEDLSDQSSVPLNASLLDESNEYPEDLNPFGDEEIEEKISTNPFGSEDEDENVVIRKKPPRPPLPTVRVEKKVVEAPRVSLNPFWSDEEDHSEEEGQSKPVPLPRLKHLQTPEPTPRRTRLSNNASQYDSNSSLSSMSSSISHTPGRKKKPAPPPPVQSPPGSKQSSPSTSTQPSPKLTPKVRKTRKAPLPPSSTPFVSIGNHGDITLSPIVDTDKSEASAILSPIGSDVEKEKIDKDEKNRNRQSQVLSSPTLSDTDSMTLSMTLQTSSDKSMHGKWKRKKGPAPSRPVPQRRQIKPLPLTELRRELDIIEMQQQGLEKQGVKLEQLIRGKCEAPGCTEETSLDPEVEDLVLELFELVNEKNELFRRQAELMYLRRQQRLEEEHADLEYQIRCLMDRPERNKTDSDKSREEELINRLLEVVERRNEIVECLEMDRVREIEEDQSINFHLSQLALKKDEENLETPVKLSKKEKKKIKKERKLKEKGKNMDVDKDIDETEQRKDKRKKKWF